MRLKLLVPTEVLIDQTVCKVVAEAANGSFCLLPQHVDFLAGLVPGLLLYEDSAGTERYVAIDQGILVKRDEEVLVSTGQAVLGGDLGQLRNAVQERFAMLDDRERAAHAAVASLEARFLRGYLELVGDQ